MTKEIRSPNTEGRSGVQWLVRHLDFGIPSDFVIRHSGSGAGSWKASSALRPCIGTRNLIVLLLVLVLETKPLDRGRERQRGRGRKGGSWKAPSPFLPCIGTMN